MAQDDLKPIYTPLVEGLPAFGSVALFPWDQRVFGFAVGGYELGDPAFISSERNGFLDALNSWGARHQGELLACTVPAERRDLQRLLGQCAFFAVDTTLAVILSAAGLRRLPGPALTVRAAGDADCAAVMQIAESAFDAGRYHADARFPRELADMRYRRWIENALRSRGDGDRVYVVDEGDRVLAFMHLACQGDTADLRLAAVEPAARGGNVGYSLFLGVLDQLRQERMRQVRSKISATNVSIVNLYAALGFRFENPEVVFHWHWPQARHLIDSDKLFATAKH